ncbi:hypothetical protein [Neisseria iguanae]|uniref:Uncharacterized protein n=1 Tax=Neisseria iguanae TaxID=90242 RepID=A0A2P7TWR5_9NEIS|nr:hypothetical protein [Neisseria iguanae]PSJ79176.1 hypothetical protein C7N83_13845 [Neisseria iguanae]
MSSENTPSKDKADDKGYDGKANRVFLHSKGFSDGMMRKAHIGCLLTEADKGYDGKGDRALLHSKKVSDGMIRKTYRGRPLTEENKGRNKLQPRFHPLTSLLPHHNGK